MSDMHPPRLKWKPWIKGLYAVLAVVLFFLFGLTGMVMNASDKSAEDLRKATQALRTEMAQKQPAVILTPKGETKGASEVDLSKFEKCTQEDGLHQEICVWDDGTGFIVINYNYGKRFLQLPRK